MKIFSYIGCLIILMGCAGNSKKVPADTTAVTKSTVAKTDDPVKRSAISPYKLNEDYTAVDTGEYSNGPMSGNYAIVKRGGVLADTIDLGFGIKSLGPQTYFYETLKKVPSDDPGSTTLSLDFSNYMLITNSKKTTINKLVPDFDNYFSSPSVIGQHIYYWQIRKIDTAGKLSISAAEYDPITKRTNSHYIMDDYLETDDSGYYPQPYSQNDTIYFDAGKNKLMKFSKDLKPYN